MNRSGLGRGALHSVGMSAQNATHAYVKQFIHERVLHLQEQIWSDSGWFTTRIYTTEMNSHVEVKKNKSQQNKQKTMCPLEPGFVHAAVPPSKALQIGWNAALQPPGHHAMNV